MKIESVKVNWWDGYGNLPQVEVTVDKIPEHDKLRYQRVNALGAALFFAHDPSGYVSYFAGTSDHHGYGGNTFKVTMLDGSKDEWTGPWSSNSLTMNRYFPASCECTLIETVEGPYGGCRYAGHLLLSELFKHKFDGVPTFVKLYSSDKELTSEAAASLVQLLRENPLAIIGEYSLTFKKPGTKSLKESQEQKAALR